MRIIKSLLILVCLTPGFMLASQDAQALTITYASAYSDNMDVNKTSVLNSPSSGTYFSSAASAYNVLLLPQFDPSLGTLLSATFTLDAEMDTSAYASNAGSINIGWDKTQYDLSFVGDSGYEGIFISASGMPDRLLGSGNLGTRFTLATSTQVSGEPTLIESGPTLQVANTYTETPLAAYIGTGNLSFFLTTDNGDALYLAGDLTNPTNYGVKTNFTAQAQVIYDYVATVPEADSYAMLIAGFGMIGFVSKRRKS